MALDPEAKKIMTETMTKATAIFATATTLMGLSLLTGLLAVNHEKTTLKGKEERLVSEKETALLKDEKSVSSQEKTDQFSAANASQQNRLNNQKLTPPQ